MAVLLTREQFRNSVFNRDGHKCVFCGSTNQLDAHHIIERRLFNDGGYYIDNGATVCQEHHYKCETTELSVEEVRKACKIRNIIIPEHLHDSYIDKWGNPILPNGQRLKGELFYEENVQKILKTGGKLDLFTDYVKYPRTMHLPWSEGVSKDDRLISSLDAFIGKRIVVTTKMDGESCSLYSDYYHARSLENKRHASRDWVKQFWATIRQDIPQGWRICGENLYAQHSIFYDNLPSYFLGFSIWDNLNTCLSWDETLEWFALLGITSVPIIYDGIYDETKIKALWNPKDWETTEGYVVRVADSFSFAEFKTHVGKFVRNNHVNTAEHWMFDLALKTNKLSK